MVGGGEVANRRSQPVHGRAGAANDRMPKRPKGSASGLAAMRKPAAYQPKSAEYSAPAPGARSFSFSQEAFPLEEQFKEF